jgi:hypothetical protein
MRSIVVLMLLSFVAVAKPSKKPVVLVKAPPALFKLVNKELGKKYQFVATTKSLSEDPTGKEVRVLTAPAKAVALMLVQPGTRFITIQMLNGSDGVPLDTVSIKTVPKKPLKKLPKDALKAMAVALASGTAPKKAVEEEVVPDSTPVAKGVDAEPKKEIAVQKTVESKAPESKQATKNEDKMASAKEAFDEKPRTADAEIVETKSESASNETLSLVAIRAGVGFKGLNRSFNWSGGSDTLAAYSLAFAPAISVDAQWFPGAHFTNSFAGNIGIYGNADIVVGLSSSQENADGTGKSYFGTQANRLRLGGIVRFQIGKHEINAHGGYSTHRFGIAAIAANDGAPRPNIPSVNFKGARFGAGGRIAVASVVLDLGASFQTVADSGELSSAKYFPAATAFGLEASGGLSFALVDHLHARLGVEWSRYFLTLNSGADQTSAASAAGDQYISGTLSVLWTM